MASIPDSRLKRLKKADLIRVIRVLERRNDKTEEFIKEQAQRIKGNTLRQIHDDIKTRRVVATVVRCKDCKHYRKDNLWCCMNSQDRSEWFNWYGDDFCS